LKQVLFGIALRLYAPLQLLFSLMLAVPREARAETALQLGRHAFCITWQQPNAANGRSSLEHEERTFIESASASFLKPARREQLA
jgi:hypothetical protein